MSRRAAQLYAAARSLTKRQGDFHFGLNDTESVMRLLECAGLESITKTLGRSDHLTVKNVSKHYQLTVDMLSRLFDARVIATLVVLHEAGQLPAAEVLFPNKRLDVPLFEKLMLGALDDGTTDMHHFWGRQLLDAIGRTREVRACVAAKDSEGVEMGVRLALPIHALQGKSKRLRGNIIFGEGGGGGAGS